MTAQINPCSINGVEGTLTYENGKYYFSRFENGESVIVSRPTTLITYAMKSMRDNINIIWLGTNGGFSTSAELIEYIEAMIDYMTPINKKYIVFGIHHLVSTVTETFETIEKNMTLHFGRHYINQRKYMIDMVYLMRELRQRLKIQQPFHRVKYPHLSYTTMRIIMIKATI